MPFTPDAVPAKLAPQVDRVEFSNSVNLFEPFVVLVSQTTINQAKRPAVAAQSRKPEP